MSKNKSKIYLNHLKKVFDNSRIKKYSNLKEKNIIIKSYARELSTVIDFGCGSLNHSNSLAKLKNIKNMYSNMTRFRLSFPWAPGLRNFLG